MPEPRHWNIIVVDDNAEIRRQVREYFTDEVVADGKLLVSDYDKFEAAAHLIEDRKADLIILDVYEGDIKEDRKKGLDTLKSLKGSGFVPVILYTAKAEGLEGLVNRFLRLVGKDSDGLANLEKEINELFRFRIPQMHRAIRGHLDTTLANYMWGFVLENWKELEAIADKPEFLRLLIQRLATSLARDGVDSAVSKVFGSGSGSQPTDPEMVHPSEYYIKPPIGVDPMLGDVRVRNVGGKKEFLVVAWPSCDMVSTRKDPKTKEAVPAKTTHVLCAHASELSGNDQMKKWAAEGGVNAENQVRALLHNNKSDRWHFIPGVWDIPDLVVDFQALEHLALDEVKKLPVLATLASPFAESLSSRLCRYLGRLGTPDLDVELVMSRLRKDAKVPPPAEKPGQKKK
jgi:CheY-like chemotaxis protein